MSLWKRTRALEAQVEKLRQESGELRSDADLLLASVNLAQGALDEQLAKITALESDRDDLAAKLGGQIDELERRVDQLAAVPVPAIVDIAPAATFDGEQHHDEPDQAPEPAAEEPELTEKQTALLAAVDELGEASTGDIARHVGRAGEGDAVSMALQKLKKLGLVAHNGRRAKGARWLALRLAPRAPEPAATATAQPVRAATPPAPAADPRPDLTELDERILRLVAQHGPVTHLYVADQVVKNRRETGARMRELARNGLLVDLDGAFATPDLADAA